MCRSQLDGPYATWFRSALSVLFYMSSGAPHQPPLLFGMVFPLFCTVILSLCHTVGFRSVWLNDCSAEKNLNLTIALNSNNAYRNQLEKVQLKYNSGDAWRLQQWSSEMMPHHLFSLNGISQLVRCFSLSVNGESIQTSLCKSEGKF